MSEQLWMCTRCGEEYRSPMKVRAVTCRAGHPMKEAEPIPIKKASAK